MQVDNFYRLPDSFATRTPAQIKVSDPKQKDPSKASKTIGLFAASSPALEAAMAAAVKVTDAEAKAHDAHDQMMEAERMLKMAEDTESILTIAAEIYDRCTPSSSLFTCHLSLSCIVFFFLYRLTSR
jgi:transcription factor MYB, plant